VTRRASPTQLMIGFLASPVSHPDHAAAKVLQAALGSEVVGRFFCLSDRDERGLAYPATVMLPESVNKSLLNAHVDTALAKSEGCEGSMRKQVERPKGERISDTTSARGNAYVLGQLELDRWANTQPAWHATFLEIAGIGQDLTATYAPAAEVVARSAMQRVGRDCVAEPTEVRVEPSQLPLATVVESLKCSR